MFFLEDGPVDEIAFNCSSIILSDSVPSSFRNHTIGVGNVDSKLEYVSSNLRRYAISMVIYLCFHKK